MAFRNKMDEHEIIERLKRLRAEDPSFRDGRILSSVSTEPLPVALDAFKIFSDTNALDTNIFPGVQKIEREIIEWFGELLKNPKTYGYITTGGTEANIMALWSAKKLYPERNEIIVPESAHYSIQRASDLMNLEIIWTELDQNFRADVNSIKDKINRNTLAVIATAGTSSLGVVDPIKEINEFCENVFFHVDAAFGGFVIPFLENKRIDFSLENLDSMTIDPHKMGLSLIPAGAILFRDESYLKKFDLSPPYIPIKTHTLSGTRSGGSIASVWATLNYLGVDGYKRIVNECMKNTEFLCSEAEKIDSVSLITKPDLNIVGLKIPNSKKVWNSLKENGWRISLNSDTKSLRIVVMPHVTKDVIMRFVADLREIVEGHLTK